MTAELVAYLRVSTGKQQTSGLGLEAQREAVERYARSAGCDLAAVFVEVESGAVKDRLQLAAALAMCRRKRATLLIARLDRLSRSLSFIAQLLDAGVEVRCADMPQANRLLLQMLAVFAEYEREIIRERTRAALAAAKVRGVELGANGRKLAEENRRQGLLNAQAASPHLQAAIASGHRTLQSIADHMNARGLAGPSGGRWHPSSVSRALERLHI